MYVKRNMTKTVMIVDDEEAFHDLYRAMLEDSGYEVVSVYDGDEALLKLEEKKPDLIITDIVLNMMTGDTLFLYIKSMPEYEHIPVIIVSNCSLRPYKNLKKIDPDLVFLDKTFTRERLIKEVNAKIA
jgi:CheY-like chemotaxis protein